MRFGLDDSTIRRIQSVFAIHPNIDEAILYGSRAKGNFRTNSDIDLTLVGDKIDLSMLNTVTRELDDLVLPYEFDLSIYSTISNKDIVEHIQRVGVSFYRKAIQDWSPTTLREISETITYGYTASATNEEIGPKFLRITDIAGERLEWDKVPYVRIDRALRQKYALKKGDIVIARTGASTGCNTVIKEDRDAVFASYLIRYRVKRDVADPFFVAYLLKTGEWKGFVGNIAGGSAQPGANAQMFADFEFDLPPINDQHRIVEILSSLDDKIDLLHRQNKTLEELAQTIFREWFVEGAKENMEFQSLGALFDIGIGRTPPRKEFQWFSKSTDDIPWVSIKDMGGAGVYISDTTEYLTRDAIERFSIPLIPIGTVLLSFKLTIGRVAITANEVTSNEAIAHFKLKPESTLSSVFLYLFLKAFNFDSLGSTSSIAEAVNSRIIKEIEIPVPDSVTLREFEGLVKPLFVKIASNTREIEVLTELRNSLLPKLMIGEITV